MRARSVSAKRTKKATEPEEKKTEEGTMEKGDGNSVGPTMQEMMKLLMQQIQNSNEETSKRLQENIEKQNEETNTKQPGRNK